METLNNEKATLLLVDDTPSNLHLLYELLHMEYTIKVATDGKSALGIAFSTPVDLILLDVVMPGLDGYEVCKALKNNPLTQSIPIIFVTSNDTQEDEEYGLNLGAIDFIRKPFRPAIVKLRVRNHILLKRKNDMLEQLSMRDGLTHIPNRRYFDEQYEACFKDSLREKRPLSVMMIDIDFFKPYNDHYGHGKGDEALIAVASALQKSLKRPKDFVARYGGEEFVVLLKNTDLEGACTVAENFLSAIRALHIPHAHSATAPHISISIGIASTTATYPDAAHLLEAADHALYRAKAEGKNRYALAPLK